MTVRSSLVLIAVLSAVGLLAFGLVRKGGARLAVGDSVPVITLPKLEGDGDVSLANYRGRWLLVNFWASWCLPCREESPALEEFQRRYVDADFTIIGIDSRDISSDGKAFVDRYGISYPQLHDGNGEAASDFGTTGVPESFLIDPTGQLRLRLIGPVSSSVLRNEVAPLLPAKG